VHPEAVEGVAVREEPLVEGQPAALGVGVDAAIQAPTPSG
jgi:hypothetical protein